jgi:signal transduction histidine kinase/CheY-like chemotaxis protein
LARLRNSLALVMLVGAAAVVIGLFAALRQSRIIAASISGLVENPSADITTGVREADQVAETLARAAADRQAAERELTSLLGSLERRVQDEVAAREQAQERLRHAQRMQALGQLAGGVAHDFNNVLQAIQGSASLLLRRYGQEEKLRRYAELIIEASERGAGITQRLLAFSSRGDLRSSRIEPAALLNEMAEMLTHTIGSGISVTVSADPSLPPLVADKRQLETVLINLATNARDAMASHGTLTLTASEKHADGAAMPVPIVPGRYIEIAVADTGSGMGGDVLARATEPFFTTKEIGQGTGLGLAMARGFAEQSGGALAIESTPGQGTTVRLWLPAADAEADGATDRDAPADAPEPARPRLLLVDDEEMIREVLSAQLEDAGYFVSVAASADEALSLLTMVQVDLLVTDLSMPGMNGVTLIREVHGRKPELPAILLTGFATEAAQLLTTQELDSALLLRKPIDGRALAERIDTLLQRTRAA